MPARRYHSFQEGSDPPFRDSGSRRIVVEFVEWVRSRPRKNAPVVFRTAERMYPLPVRLISSLLAVLLFFSGSPALFAMSAYQAFGGGGGGGGKGSAANLQNAGAASAALTAARAQATLRQTTAAVAAMQALQAAARAALVTQGGVKNGLATGWLDPYNPSGKVNARNVPSTWSGISSLKQTGNTVGITQSSQNAYLYWNNFNVGPQTTVAFNQSAGGNKVGDWIAFNKVMGNVNPTQIFGSITAQGQVYILNQNGILFHNGSQVNTHTLVASTLPINENLAGDALDGVSGVGIANNPTYQFLFTALDSADYDPKNQKHVVVSGSLGSVVVEQGATISSPASASHTGGLVALIGPNVENDGTISTPNGQTILAAGLQVGLTPHPSSDPTLRGMDVTVGKVNASGIQTHSVLTGANTTGQTGVAENNGYIGIMEGDATMAGATILQNGVIDSSTSVSLNGRINLLADYNATLNSGYNTDGNNGPPIFFKSTGVVDLGPGSVMRILPEWSSSDTVTGTSLALNSVVSIIGSSIQMEPGSILEAPGAVATPGALSETGASLASGVTIQAGTWFQNGLNVQFIYSTGQITLDSGAQIDVSGSTDVQVESAQNFITLQLRGAELADSPLQQGNNQVRGQSLTIDERMSGTYVYDGVSYYWIGTPLGDATGFAGLIERTVAQLTEQGGTVSLAAGNSISMQEGSEINVSGGWTQYSGGTFSTTDLVTQGHLINISQATPNLVYSGIYSSGATVESSSKWGVTQTFDSPLDPTRARYEAPYISGASGGSISIQAPSTVLNGNLYGNTVTGPRQLRETASLSTLPGDSSLAIDLFTQAVNDNLVQIVAPNAPSVMFADNGLSSQSSLVLSPGLVSSDGFGNLNILNHDGTITLPAGVVLNSGVSGSVTLEAANLDIEGSITAPGGSISLTADLAPYSVINAVSLYEDTPTTQPLTDVVTYLGPTGGDLTTGGVYAQHGTSSGGMTQLINSQGVITSVPSGQVSSLQAGIVTVGRNALLSTAGLVVNDTPRSSDAFLPVAINGGQISLSGYRVNLKQGGVLNVSGGALLPVGGATVFGNAGSITISGGHDLDAGPLNDIISGYLRLGSTLEGYAGAGSMGIAGGTAGSLSISTQSIQIGGSASGAEVVDFSPEFFNQGGFGTFNLTGIGLQIVGSPDDFVPGILIAPGTVIQPEVAASILTLSDQGPSWSTFTPPYPYASAPNISLKATGLTDTDLSQGSQLLIRGDLVMGVGSSITLNPQIVLSGETATAKTGSVTLSGETVAIMGSITAPGGAITISGSRKTTSIVNNIDPTAALVTVDLAPTARLSTAGEALFVQDPLGLRQAFGAVLPGGFISASGNILAESGSVLDASGAGGVYDLFSYQLGISSASTVGNQLKQSVVPYDIQTAGGTITLSGGEELYSDATLTAQSGGPTAPGGILNVSSGRFYQPGEDSFDYDLNLAISQGGSSIPVGFQKSGSAAIGRAIPDSGGISEGGGHITVDSFAGGGFDSVTLGGNVIFNGPVTLAVPGTLRVASGGVLSADSTVNLSASYAVLGTPFASPIAFGNINYPAPPDVFGVYLSKLNYGTGRLNVTAELIDIGNIALENIGAASLNAHGGAIRGDGTIDIAGDLTLDASEIYPVSGTAFTLVAYNHDATSGAAELSGGVAGSITVERNGSYNLPLSAEGTLDLYASSITQGGVLLAPFGTINLGWAGSGTQPGDPLTGAGVAEAQSPLFTSLPKTETMDLTSGSVTSISGVDPRTGAQLSVPYGTSPDGATWIDPSGTDITTRGLSGKSINLTAGNLTTGKDSLIDLQGGGNMTASQWINGNGGTINLLGSSSAVWNPTGEYAAGDLVSFNGSLWSARSANSGKMPQTLPTTGLIQNSDPTAAGYASAGLYWTKISSSSSYAIIPGYQSGYAPTGYADGSLAVGSRVTIAGGAGLPAGTYTLLPASYATQPGAYLISPTTSSSPLAGSITQPDGSEIVSGTQFNGLDSAITAPRTTTFFQLLSPSAIAARVDYQVLSAGSFFSSVPSSSQPADAGNLVFKATTSMALNGSVIGEGAGGANGASIDISAPGNIDITQNGTGGVAGDIVLGASQLSSWSFGSLLIGGSRGTTANGLTPVNVSASDITVEAGSALNGNDIILAASDGITLDAESSITASGNLAVPDASLSVSGDGALLRVGVDKSASSTRSGSDGNAIAGVSIGAGASLSGASITLDSSGKASIDGTAVLNGKTINLSAGKIAVDFGNSSQAGSLNLSGNVLQNLSSAEALNLSSYSSIDFLGSGVLGSASLASLGLHAGEILGDNNSADTIQAVHIVLDNKNKATGPGGSLSASGGSLTISGSVLTLGSGALAIGGFQSTKADLSGGVEGMATKVLSDGTKVAGTLNVGGDLTLTTPILTGMASSATTITAGGVIDASATASGSSLLTPGLGASLTLQGSSLNISVPIDLPSGSASLQATGANGDLALSSAIDAGGFTKQLFNATEYTSGGSISLSSENGNLLLAGSSLNVNAPTGGASAGSLSFSAPEGTISSMPSAITGTAPNGTAGSFTADLGSYNGGDLDSLESTLTAGGFTHSQNLRDRNDLNVSVTDAKASSYTLTADQGSITVNGTINASDVPGKDSLGNPIKTGGNISLFAGQSVVIGTGATLNVSGQNYDNAGKGGSIDLEAGNSSASAVIAATAPGSSFAAGTSVVDLQSGATLNLAITAKPRAIDAAGDSDQFGGTLHLRAPQTVDGSDVQVNPIGAIITGASLITVEGFFRQDAAQSDSSGVVTIDSMEGAALNNATSFMNNASTVSSRLLSLNGSLNPVLQVAPGEEIDNSLGSLVLNSDWDLSSARYGPNAAPGFLTLRAAGNITFNASLSDGFQGSLYTADLLSQNTTTLPANFQSWAYQITAGADFGSANPNAVVSGSGANVTLGIPYTSGGQNVAPSPGLGAQTSDALAGPLGPALQPGYYYQVIRTGTGNISIAASGDLQLWNQFASIYTAGVQVADQTDETLGGTFDVPALGGSAFFNQGGGNTSSIPYNSLGVEQESALYLPQFSYAGGNLNVTVGGNITQLTHAQNGNTVADSDSELPSNWLYRRGAVNPVTGTFLQTTIPVSEVESTAWWVDFSNFFDDLGALGGGNIALNAGGNVSNINASIPTNFRMPGRDAKGKLIQAGSVAGVELGGGDLLVHARNDIDAGVYYVESGNASLQAGGGIITNPTRDPNDPSVTSSPLPGIDSVLSYLPTTFFLGKGSINVEAAGSILLGPVANVFMTPQGVNNSYWYKTYFSTYASSDQIDVQSLGGSITFREEAVTSTSETEPMLYLWINGLTDPALPSNLSYYQPWLRLAEANINGAGSAPSLSTLLSIEPPTLDATALSGSITFQGSYTTMPSPTGNISLVAAHNINGLTGAGVNASDSQVWIASQINLSDANPAFVNGINDPLSMRSQTPSTDTSKASIVTFLAGQTTDTTTIDNLFAVTGSYFGQNGTVQTKDELNDTASLLHGNDPIPLQIYAEGGNISGLTLYSAKQADISAGGDITDIGFYIQNNSASDVSIVSAGGKIITYDPTSPLQQLAQAANSGTLESGDIQISGPGTLEVLAGGNVDLGNNPGSGDPTLNVGITSIGNSRNPALPFASADIVVGAGMKLPTGLSSTDGLGLENFANTVLSGAGGDTYLSELTETMTYSGDPLSGTISAASFSAGSTQLSSEEKARLELQLFYIVLRDTGRNHNEVGSPGFGSYASGEKAIQTFFGNSGGSGNITTWSQDISTLNGGNIDIFAPGGGLTLASTAPTGKSASVAPGIITEGGGTIDIYTQQNVDIGIGRIFTLKGGDIMMWSDEGNIAAGASAKTVQSAPPTQVLIDPQSGNVETDLAGLATGGGIGVLTTVAGIPPGNVDLIAPAGVIDAGDAGIRSSGNLNLAATSILNADNIAAVGTTSGAPPAAPPPAAPNISGATAASSAAAANNSAAQSAQTNSAASDISEPPPSIISVEVLGYGGGDGSDDNSTTSSSPGNAPQASL